MTDDRRFFYMTGCRHGYERAISLFEQLAERDGSGVPDSTYSGVANALRITKNDAMSICGRYYEKVKKASLGLPYDSLSMREVKS